jgi:hypothetical protein
MLENSTKEATVLRTVVIGLNTPIVSCNWTVEMGICNKQSMSGNFLSLILIDNQMIC